MKDANAGNKFPQSRLMNSVRESFPAKDIEFILRRVRTPLRMPSGIGRAIFMLPKDVIPGK